MANLFEKIFGTYSEREIKRITRWVRVMPRGCIGIPLLSLLCIVLFFWFKIEFGFGSREKTFEVFQMSYGHKYGTYAENYNCIY